MKQIILNKNQTNKLNINRYLNGITMTENNLKLTELSIKHYVL